MSEATNTSLNDIVQQELDEYAARQIREWGEKFGLSKKDIQTLIEQERAEAIPFADFEENTKVTDEELQYGGASLSEGTQLDQPGGKSDYPGVE